MKAYFSWYHVVGRMKVIKLPRALWHVMLEWIYGYSFEEPFCFQFAVFGNKLHSVASVRTLWIFLESDYSLNHNRIDCFSTEWILYCVVCSLYHTNETLPKQFMIQQIWERISPYFRSCCWVKLDSANYLLVSLVASDIICWIKFLF